MPTHKKKRVLKANLPDVESLEKDIPFPDEVIVTQAYGKNQQRQKIYRPE